MLLHQRFVRTAKTFASKTAIIDRTTGTRLSYGRALAASLILVTNNEREFKRIKQLRVENWVR